MTTNSSAEVGETREVCVGTCTSKCRISMASVAPLLFWDADSKTQRRPVRDLTLEEAAHVVAALHAAGHVRLCESKRPYAEVEPRFAEGCASLVFPGPNLETKGRFTVGMKPWIELPVPGKPPRRLRLLYGPTLNKKTGKLEYDESPLPHQDVRTVVVLYHLASELLAWTDLYDVTAIVHAGFTRAQTVVRDGNRDSHRYGRAIDFNGVLHDSPQGEKAVLVGADWGAQPAPSDGKFYRLEKQRRSPDAAPARRLAAELFHRAYYRVFEYHCAVKDEAPYEYVDSNGMGVDAKRPANTGSVCHPDHGDGGTAAAHNTHIHAQLGRGFGYEFPSVEAWLDDLQLADPDVKHGANRMPAPTNTPPAGWPGSLSEAQAKKGPPRSGYLAPRGLRQTIKIDKA